MSSDAPYQSPESQIINKQDFATQKVRILSFTQRIGRLRYLAYLGCGLFLFSFVSGIFGSIILAALSASESISATLFGQLALVITYTPLLIAVFVLTIRRLHDLDRSGWQSILLLIPLVNLIIMIALMLVPGDQQANRFGPPPGENTAFTWLGALIPLILLLLALGVGYWAYQDFQQVSEKQPTSVPRNQSYALANSSKA
ncbi:MAG: DUF805 domain-containing protein [Kangiellaceae bacterium]|nr:DUF805 domain-containing protein [Kangiellaceae bacterium]MCW9015336.1 DUF805 domain-containing protein [Kangiellaceae bacterium]